MLYNILIICIKIDQTAFFSVFKRKKNEKKQNTEQLKNIYEFIKKKKLKKSPNFGVIDLLDRLREPSIKNCNGELS